MKKLFTIFILLFSFGMSAQISFEEKTEKVSQLKNQLISLSNLYENDIRLMTAELIAKIKKYDEEARWKSDNVNAERVEEVMTMEKSIELYKSQGNKEINKKYYQLFGVIEEDLNLVVKNHFFKKNTEGLEGIWEFTKNGKFIYKLVFVKENFNYNVYLIEQSLSNDKVPIYFPTELIAKVEQTSDEKLIFFEWYDQENKDTKQLAEVSDGRMIRTIDKNILVKTFPAFISIKNNDRWLGNGSGIIISKSGYIVTNHHVVDGAKEIEVEFILNEEVQKFKAEVVQKDIRNDLAIVKIVDVNFDGLEAINYNFKTRSSDVGTKIYTFGYPKALSGMGKEMKVTEGIISSKSGVMGDITTYQITAPIQGGNSGGPLFDDEGNLIGINSSKFNSEETENVNYSIKSSYVLNLIDVLPKSIDLPSSTKLQSSSLTDQIKEISKYVVLVKVK